MCAINPTHKKRLLLDVYTSDTGITEADFVAKVLGRSITVEKQLNSAGDLRWHLKETDQEAE